MLGINPPEGIMAIVTAETTAAPAVALPSCGELPHRNTKIVCTLGPASASPERIGELLAAGADVLRLNFSHGDHAWHSEVLTHIRRIAARMRRPVAVIQDLCGPKLRISHVAADSLVVAPGEQVRVTTARHVQVSLECPSPRPAWFDLATSHESLLADVPVGRTILIDDGRVELVVRETREDQLVAEVRRGGPIRCGKGINLPGAALSVDAVTEKDWQDLEWAISKDIDFVALSFVRQPEDLLAVRNYLDDVGSPIRLIAKIERPEAIENLDGILGLADALMVARGDLGVETELARVPLLQKRLIERCCQAGKPVITATQMLESMVHDSTPTRAEVSDVANAICDGTDAIMLSAETATGRFPIEAVGVLDKVARFTDADLADAAKPHRRRGHALSLAAAIVDGAAQTALGLRARCLVVYSQSGLTARLMARCRLPMPVVAVTNALTTYRQLSLSYGVQPVYLPQVANMQQLLAEIDASAARDGWAEPGDMAVVVTALDGRDGNTDTLHVHRVRG